MKGDGPETDNGEDGDVATIHPDGGWSSLDFVLDVLTNQRRRYALYYLQEETTATLREISQQVAAWEHQSDGLVGADLPTEAVYTEFYHQHLPKLTDANVVDYDPREELVRYDSPEVLERVLDLIRWIDHPDDGAK